MLRPGNVHSADRWKELLEPVVRFHDFKYQAVSWHKSRHVVTKVELHQGDLFPRAGFIVTNMSAGTEGVVRFYNGCGIAEQWIKEGKYARNWMRLSCKHLHSNQVRLGLFIMAYNLGNFLRRLVLPGRIKHWSLWTSLVKLIKIGAMVFRHSCYAIFQMGKVAIGKEIFAEIISKISRIRCCSQQ